MEATRMSLFIARSLRTSRRMKVCETPGYSLTRYARLARAGYFATLKHSRVAVLICSILSISGEARFYVRRAAGISEFPEKRTLVTWCETQVAVGVQQLTRCS